MSQGLYAMRIFIIALFITGCAIQNPTLMDVEGSWESSGLFYQRIEIDEDGTGYFAAGLDDYLELCVIQKIVLDKTNLVFHFACEESESSMIKAEGYVTTTAVVITKFTEDGVLEELDAPYFYLKESLAESTKKAMKDKINEARKSGS